LHLPAWGSNYGEFISELKTYFRSLDLVGESENKLKNITMKPNQQIAKYLIEFNQLSTITGWDNHALQHQFYCRVPSCIKDEMSCVGKPNTLPDLQTLALSINSRYWE
jgi:hypothetical protein